METLVPVGKKINQSNFLGTDGNHLVRRPELRWTHSNLSTKFSELLASYQRSVQPDVVLMKYNSTLVDQSLAHLAAFGLLLPSHGAIADSAGTN